MLFWIVLSLCLISTVVFTVKRGLNVTFSDLVLKTVSSLLFVAVALVAIISNPDVNLLFAMMVVAGAVLGLLGDIFLELKWILPKDNESFFKFGFITFMLQHLLLIAAVFICYPMEWMNVLICFVAPAVVLLVSGFAVKITKMDMGKFKVISNAYGAIASMTFSVGFMTMTTYSMGIAQILFFVGAVLFFISDLVLSQIFFTEKGHNRFFVTLNHILYYGAQILIASSLFFMK